jgi:nucleotide-binding universal stress UspA family protein
MNNIIACIDESENTDSICAISAWASKQTSLRVSLLHVASPHYDTASIVDLSGQIGLGAKSNLLKKLTSIDEEHGKLEQKKGQILLEHAAAELVSKNIKAEIIHRRGSLVQTVSELEKKAELFIMGKYGERTNQELHQLGYNIESVAQTVRKPLLVVTRNAKPISQFLIAFDGSLNSEKAVSYIADKDLLKGAECHLIQVGELNENDKETLNKSAKKLEDAGFKVTTRIIKDKSVSAAVTNYIEKNSIDLLAIGAYRHSKIHNLIFGSTTTSLLRKSDVPVLLFR